MIRIKIATVALLLVALSQTTFSQQTHQFSLQQALAYAQKNNVQVKNALLDVQLQQQVNREVTGSAYPQINGTAGITDNIKLPKLFFPKGAPDFLSGSGTPLTEDVYFPNLFSAPWSGNAGASISQLLFDGQVFTGLKARKTLIDYQEKNVEVSEEMIRQNISKLYYQLVLGKTQLALIDTNIALIEKNKRDTKIMYDNGFAEMLDIDKLNVQLTNLNSQKSNVQNQITNGYLGLKVLMGMPVKDELVLTDELTEDNIKDGVLDAMTFDYTQRKDFQAAVLGEKLGAFDVQRYKYSKLPTVSLSGNWNYMTMTNQFRKMFNGDAEWYPVSAVSLNINIPIFNGFATNARIAQSKIKLQKTQNQIEALKLNIDQEREAAINTFKSAITDMDYQKQNMTLAEKVYQQTKKKYEVGTGTQIEIDNARVQLQSAQTNYYNALYNAVIARVDFLKAVGKL